MGFLHTGISPIQTHRAHHHLLQWLENQFEGDMYYMRTRSHIRQNPSILLENIQCAICVALPYVTTDKKLQTNQSISIYAKGQDYHLVVKEKLRQLQSFILHLLEQHQITPPPKQRIFCDSAPVFEVEFAQQAGLGWRGKHTLLIHPKFGSLFFLGEILTTLPLPVDAQSTNHCGRCTKCLDICPTKAFVSPYVLDARRCISYLTIEHQGAIDVSLRPLMGQHIYGCDDCQAVCPWNKFATPTTLPEFLPKKELQKNDLDQLIKWIGWTEDEFSAYLSDSAILRIGRDKWIRNISIALGNLLRESTIKQFDRNKILQALYVHQSHPVAWVREHIDWAIHQQPTS